ncbi:MAG: hypothetical protein ACFB9N_08120 [Geitlerinemataceae cyanobacterium]
MDEALKLLKDGEQRQWLIADWGWHEKGRGNGGVYLGLLRPDAEDRCLRDASWDVNQGDGLTGFRTWWDEGSEHVQYRYAPISNDCWPLVVRREFHGLAENQCDLLEEFRLYHNLWHDRTSDNYYKIKNDGDKQKIVHRDKKGAMLVDTASLRQFCAARELLMVLQVDAVQYFEEVQEEISEEIRQDNLCMFLHKTNDPDFIDKPSFGRLLGKRVIRPLSIEKCGGWPFKKEKTYESFIIGVDEEGEDVLFTSNPDELGNYFGANPDSPQYLTPISFRKDVLKKYLERPSLCSVDDGHLSCGSAWGVRIDNDHEDVVVVFLGDLGRDLPESEQRYWRAFNVRPERGLSDTCLKRSFFCQPASAENFDHAIKAERRKMRGKWQEAFEFSLYAELHEDDIGILSDLRVPISEEWVEFDRCTIAASKVFIDYLNESPLGKMAKDEIRRMKAANPDRPIRGIDKLQAWFVQNGGENAPLESVNALRTLQSLRSKSSAHRKNSELRKLLSKHNLDQSSPRDVYKEMVAKPLLEYCRSLQRFAESKIEES